MAIEDDLSAAGVPYPLAAEIINAIRTGVATPQAFVGVGLPAPAARELATQINTRTGVAHTLTASGFPPLASSVIKAIITSGVGGAPLAITRSMGFRSDGTSTLASQESWLGAPADYVTVFAEQNNGANSWAANLAFTQSEIAKWAGSGKEIRWAQCLCTGQAGEGADATIAGTHDAVIRSIYQEMANAAPAGKRIFVRIGWEPNLLTAYPWGSSFITPTQYIAAFQRHVNIARSVSPLFAIEFVVSWRKDSGVDFRTMYPGDAFVDAIGIDAYCKSQDKGTGNVPSDDVGHANYMFTAPYGINMVRDFAVQRGKPLCANEWAPNYDNALFITLMADFIRANNVTHHSYWDQNNGDFTCKLSDDQWPNAAAEFTRQFGPFNILTYGIAAAPGSPLSGAIQATKAFAKIEVLSGNGVPSGILLTAPARGVGTERAPVRLTDERGLTAEGSVYMTWQTGSLYTFAGEFGSRMFDHMWAADLARVSKHRGAVKGVTSRTGASRVALAAAAANQPAYTKRNGYPLILGDGSNDALVQTEMSNVPQAQQAVSEFAMLFTDATAANFTYSIVEADDNSVRRAIGVNAGNLRMGDSGGAAGDAIAGDRVVSMQFGAGATSAVRSTVDGAAAKTASVAIAATTYTRSVYLATGNAAGVTGSYYKGGFYEIAKVSGTLTTDEEARGVGHLAWKYGREATLPSGHPFRNNPPMIAT